MKSHELCDDLAIGTPKRECAPCLIQKLWVVGCRYRATVSIGTLNVELVSGIDEAKVSE